MTDEEKILTILNQEENKNNFVMISEHIAKEQLEYARMTSEEAYEEALKEHVAYKESFSYEKLCPLLTEVWVSMYTSDEIEYFYQQSQNPIIKQITAKAGEVNISIMEKLEVFIQQGMR